MAVLALIMDLDNLLFNGVGTAYLGNYIGWMRLKERTKTSFGGAYRLKRYEYSD